MDSPAAGILLIADPFLKDPNFKRSVIFLCEHQSEGSFGFLLNKTYEYSLKDLVNNADDLEFRSILEGLFKRIPFIFFTSILT
jgi:putative transcriptional regulator